VRNGCRYYELFKSPTTSGRVTAIVNATQKLLYEDAFFTIDAITNSYKYGSELQIKAYSHTPPRLVPRTDKEHTVFRLDPCYLPLIHATAEQFRNVANSIDQTIGYSEPVVTAGQRVNMAEVCTV
jgi:hypothetical protein